jgi:hypothetical protein
MNTTMSHHATVGETPLRAKSRPMPKNGKMFSTSF